MMLKTAATPWIIALSLGLAACSGGSGDSGGTPPPPPPVVEGPTPKADCGPGSRPETGLQGRVSREDHLSGRAADGYTCNTELVGSYAPTSVVAGLGEVVGFLGDSLGPLNDLLGPIGEGLGTLSPVIGTVGGFKVERYVDQQGRECAYYDSTLLYPLNILDGQAGVNVLDMSDPASPKLVKRLLAPSMLSPHESLVVSQEAGILAAVLGNPALAPGIVDVYDLSEDCRNPQYRGSTLAGLGHESGLSPDGKTFFSASPGTPTLTAVDLADPSNPRTLWTGGYTSHGLSISADGNRAYLASGTAWNEIPLSNGVLILDISEIQARKPSPQVREISRITWPNKSIPQNAIPFTRDGRPYLLEIDEYSANQFLPVTANGDLVGAGRIIDISDETTPVIVSNLRLEVHEPEHRAALSADPGALNPAQGYAGHYCNIPTRVNPDIAACSMILSGLRIFDIRDPHNPREVAYFNAPIPPRLLLPTLPALELPGLPALALPALEPSNWAMSSPAFVPERKEIWYSDGFSGFYVVRVTNGAW